MKRFVLLVTGALLLSLTALVPMTSALADSKGITFEPPAYSTATGVPPGSIDGQDGWAGSGGAPINPAYDQAVVSTTVPGFDTQAFRMSNAVTSGSFADWPFSPSLAHEAGETSAVSDGFSGGTRQPGFQASFDVASTVPGAVQPGLQVSISPDRGDGARMSFLKLRDTAGGLALDFADYESGKNETGCTAGTNFVTTTVATMNRSTSHNIKLTMDFFNGSANDIVKVYVDGTLVHTGTSWEDYYRECESTSTRTVDSLIFQSRTQSGDTATTWAANAGNGFLFDNLNYSSGPLAKCTQTGFIRDGINMTAAQIGGNVTGTLDATGCNIGVYYDSTHTGNVTGAAIFGANYFGVAVNGDAGAVTVNVTGSTIHDIGEAPLDGTQHGNAIYYRAFGTGAAATATISGNTLTNYQKGGIVVGGNVSATIKNNTVTGQTAVSYIAQNGIQVGYGAKATVTGNTVSGNQYTGTGETSSAGILVVGGPCFGLPYTVNLSIQKNTLTNNDVGIWLFNAVPGADPNHCVAGTIKTNNAVKFNTISNNQVTNTTGYRLSPPCGYQAGVADVGHKDLIVNNKISGIGYTPQAGGDCNPLAATPAFLRSVDTDSSARAVPSNK
jgi:Right handed beta helix region